MIVQNTTKIIVDGVEVFPDSDSSHQFWYIPSEVRLAERNNKKILSYLWYIDGNDDTSGRGFLNFEVNTQVSENTKNTIRTKLSQKFNIEKNAIRLAPVTYDSGKINFSVLGPVAQQAAKSDDLAAVIYQNDNQIVWQAGSSSLIGDNTGVCAIEFTKQGKLAAAMKAAIEQEANQISVVYSLEYTALRPAVSFTVTGKIEKFMNDLKASVGAPIPLKAFILNLGFQQQVKTSWEKRSLDIKLIKYTVDKEDALAWAQEIFTEYILKDFFEVQLTPDGKWNPLSKEPEITKLIKQGNQLSNKEKGSGKEKGSDVAAGMAGVIPTANVRIANFTGFAKRELNFTFNESSAKVYRVAPQSAVLEDLRDPEDHIVLVNRSQMPFGMPYPIQVIGPSDDDFKKYGLRATNIKVSYPANAPSQQQQTQSVSFPTEASSRKQLDFQYNDQGDEDISYEISEVYNPSSNWNDTTFQYLFKDTVSHGLISAMPGDHLKFLSIQMLLLKGFVWSGYDQVTVLVTSNAWPGAKATVFTEAESSTDKTLNIRVDTSHLEAFKPNYQIIYRDRDRLVHQTEPRPLPVGSITIPDLFTSHVKIFFYPALEEGISRVVLTVQYLSEENNYSYESPPIDIKAGESDLKEVIIPTKKDFNPGNMNDFVFTYTVLSSKGVFSKQGKGTTVFVTGVDD